MKIIKTFEKFNENDKYEFQRIVNDIRKNCISEEDKLKLDEFCGYQDIYDKTYTWLKNKLSIFKDHSLEEIEDRFVEYFDKILDWSKMCMFTISQKGSSLGINEDKLDDESYFYSKLGDFINDINYKINSKWHEMTVDKYFEEMKPSVFVDFNMIGQTTSNTYKLSYIEPIIDELVASMGRMYGYKLSHSDFPKEGRYDRNIDIYNYSFTLNLV